MKKAAEFIAAVWIIFSFVFEQNITVEVLEEMTDDLLKELVPLIGDRLKFKINLKKWIETKLGTSSCSETNIENIPVIFDNISTIKLNEPSPKRQKLMEEIFVEENYLVNSSVIPKVIAFSPTVLCTPEASVPSTSTGISEAGTSSASTLTIYDPMLKIDDIDVEDVLQHNIFGKAILKKYEIKQELEPKDRTMVCDILVSHCLNNELFALRNIDIKILSTKIIKLFPKENVSTYWISPITTNKSKRNKSEGAMGKLYDKYRNKIRILRRSKLNLDLPDVENINDLDDSEHEVNTKAADAKIWLSENTEPMEEILEKWESSYFLRQKDKCHLDSVQMFMDNWPILKTHIAFDLIEKDFMTVYPDARNIKFEEAFKTFFEDILQKRADRLSTIDKTLLNLLSDEISSDSQNSIKLYLLPALVPQKGKVLAGKTFWKPSTSETRMGFVTHITTIGDLEKTKREKINFMFGKGSSLSVNVHFENKDGGFFLKQQPRQHYSGSSTNPLAGLDPLVPLPGGPGVNSGGTPLSIDRFTVLQSSQPISVRATYGPFSTKQTVPARYVVPDPMPLNTTGPAIDLQDQATHHLDMSAHIVRNEVPRDSPVLRVLFHTGTDPGGRRQILLARHHQRVCIVLHATMGQNPPLHAACSPDGEDGVCLAQVTIPSSWWPPLPSPDKEGRPGKLVKSPPRLVQVAYSVLEPWPDEGEGCHPKMQVQPSVILGTVPLTPAKGAYKELKLTDAITMLVPHPPLFPMSRIHISVFIDRLKAKALTAIVIRARVKSGIRLLEATPSGASPWNITVDINPRHTGATVTLVRKEPPEAEMTTTTGEVMELFTWLLEVTEDATEIYDGARIVWTARFEPHQDESDLEIHRGEGRKSTTRLEIQKDDIQAVVPISKNWEVLNTAVLTGQQVSQAMKVFIVSQAGKAADVTFQASCHSEDDNVLKVSSSCGSVYVDGSEQRGSVNGSVLVKYGTYTGLAKFTVWMPEFPLELAVADTRLSQLKSWRVPDYHPVTTKSKRRKRSFIPWTTNPDDMGNVIDKPICRLRYQQTSVDVYAHFMATDHESGRVTYLINRRTWLRVTDLVLPWLRVSDPRIASLHGRVLQGRSMGRTEVQVLSPITSRVYGSKEIRVGNDKVGLTKMSVQVVSGLQLNISPDSSIENGYVAETSVTRKLTAQYQEGLLDIELEFSDGTKTALRDISDTDYHLVVESLDPEVVAFAPMVASHHPRVIAVGEGSGDLLQVTLLLSEECRVLGRPKMKTAGPLATAAAHITVDFSSSDLAHRPDILQNDGGNYGGSSRDFVNLQDIVKGTPLKDENSHEPNVQARQYQGNKGVLRNKRQNMHMTPLEISMYVLLAAFCCAIAVFVVSCVVYASKFKPIEPGVTSGIHASPVNPSNLVIHREPRKPRESTQNAHDWVWLGRATMDTTSNRNSTVVTNNNGQDMRIITNPLNTNYVEPDDALATSFTNPNHIELPSRPIGFSCSTVNETSSNGRSIDSTTYCRSKGAAAGGRMSNVEVESGELVGWNKPTPPPPLPPHAVPLPSKKSPPIVEDYRPPVPPHRNLPSTSTAESPIPSGISTPKRHHHHHQRNGSRTSEKLLQQAMVMETLPNEGSRPGSGLRERILDDGDDRDQHVFEFDDEPQVKKETGDKMEFVQYPRSPNAKSNRNSAEVKRATIVGNPMFSANNDQNDNTGTATAAAAGVTPAELPGLDDLQLDMDYDQIMHYFENLKESNA